MTPNGNSNLAEAGYSRAVLSTVDAITLSSSLYYDQGNKCWAFGMTAAGNKADLKVAYSLREAQADAWTHLAGTYGSTTKTLALHVDGIKQGEVTGLEAWQVSQLLVGRQRWNGQDATRFAGSIDEFKVHNRTLNTSEIKGLATQAGIRAHYKISEGACGPRRTRGQSGTPPCRWRLPLRPSGN